jgi:GGDEF domain-containing protein
VFNWDSSDAGRFNPMDSCRHARIDIAVMEAVDALRAFVVGETGVRRMSNEDFANLLRASAESADRVSNP